MVQRLKTAKEGWFWLAKTIYLFCLPFLLFIGAVTLYALNSPRAETKIAGLPLFTLLVWTAVLVPVAVFVYGIFSRRRLLKSITASLRDSDYFNPDATYEMYHEGDGKYLGIDTHNGTILYVHKIRNGAVDVVALTMGDWINREVEGNMLRLYTKLPQLPRIEFSTPWAQRWFDTLGAMEHKHYSTAQPFARYVGNKLETLERDHHIQIPRVA